MSPRGEGPDGTDWNAWQIEDAQAILNLRAICDNDDWDAFHAVRIQAEHKLYAHKRRLLTILNYAT